MGVRACTTALALTFALVGCSSEEPPPRVLPPLPSAKSTPGDVPQQPPAAAARSTPDGASLFVRFYLDGVNAAFAKSDAQFLRRFSTASCTACQKLIQAVEAPTNPGEKVTGGDYAVVSVASPPVISGETTSSITYFLTAVRVLDPAGRVIREKPASAVTTATMTLATNKSSWVVTRFENAQ